MLKIGRNARSAVNNKIIFILLIIALQGCKEQTKPLVYDEEINMLEGQNLNWLMSAKRLRDNVTPDWKVDIEIIRSYFPMYLAKRKQGLNQQQFGIVVDSFRRLGREKAESEIWNFTNKTIYEEKWLRNFAVSSGFDQNQVDTFEEMMKLRNEYFNDLQNFKRSQQK